MKRITTIIILLLHGIFIAAQQEITITGQIVDRETEEILPFTNVYIKEKGGTISNFEGHFSIKEALNDTLFFSYVGYEPQSIVASKVSKIVTLAPMSYQLQEVEITPTDIYDFVKKLFANTKKTYNLKKNRRAAFFYRQITQTNGEANEILEAFFNANSALFLRDMGLVTGRYGAVVEEDNTNPYTTYINFFNFSQASPILPLDKIENKNIIVPLNVDFERYYQLSYDILFDKGGNRLYKIRFKPREEVKRGIIDGFLYVDPSNLSIKRMDGRLINIRIEHKEEHQFVSEYDCSFSMNFKYINKFPEVESVHVKLDVEGKLSSQVNSILYNVGKVRKTGKKKITRFMNLLSLIAQTKYSPKFWEENEVIKRTPLEEETIQAFEKKQIFGTYSLQ
ncbi:carboxypeptidase-like regulatory domain-containing protein [Bacteroides sp. 224]|uniref:carboxypeptidase-like regulatory domain-containing protein n=1 Tax=Bacteroides sp. 224 TaxID=2302936 RepID=UPI0013D3ED11|nr:carboxypeptidase-like regulatory domain-containing protein [Bacteroides sp. 224]NDV63750.1 carboxypeptidase-like regulatory domain-containing protein [Bacteroides sp. 224]